MDKKDLSIVIVNYNGQWFLEDCFTSIKKCCAGMDYEVIVFDNASQDNSIKLIEDSYPDINLIKSLENLGFAKGNNLAVKEAKGKYILLLNNDTILSNSIRATIELIKRENIGVLGIKMLGKNNEYRKSVGRFPSAIRLLKLSKLYYSSKEFKTGDFKSKIYEVDWVEGSFLLTKKEIWDQVGGLDETYFMYVEDVDYCKKVSLLSKKCVYYTDCVFIHFGGYNSKRQDLLKKGFKKYLCKHKKGPNKIIGYIFLELNFIIKNAKKAFTKTIL